MDFPAAIPVHVLTGHLGSGKTTLLNRVLLAGFGAETAVIVNEFGSIGLDQLFVHTRSEEVIVLKNGCVCCTVRSDLAHTLLQLAERYGPGSLLRRILIETSGISDPLPILLTLRSEPQLMFRFSVGKIVCTVGASDDTVASGRPEVLAQITAADALVITKTDLVDEPAAHAVRSAVAELNPLADILEGTGHALVRWIEHAETQRSDTRHTLASLRLTRQINTHGVRSTAIFAPSPASWSQFAIWLTRLVFLHGDRVLRTKGVLYDHERQVWIGVHGVRRFFHPPVHLTLPATASRDTCLVFITDKLDPAGIETSYRRMVCGEEAPPATMALGASVEY